MKVEAKMNYYAKFLNREKQQFRLDTRIYLDSCASPQKSKDNCIAAVVAKNPGSASPIRLGSLEELTLDGDKLLPTVRNRFLDAFEIAGVPVPANGFVRVWNLLYLCNPNLNEALKTYPTIKRPLGCKSERSFPPIVWFAWGPPKKGLDEYKARFLEAKIVDAFFYDMDKSKVIAKKPKPDSRVKHTQGMPKGPINDHLARLIK